MGLKYKRLLLKGVVLLLDIVGFVFTGCLSFLLTENIAVTTPVWGWIGVNVLLCVAFFILFGLYDFVFERFGLYELMKTAAVLFILGVANLLFAFATEGAFVSWKTVVVFFLLSVMVTLTIRASKRVYESLKSLRLNRKGKTRVMIVGGGNTGLTLIREMLSSEHMQYSPVCIVDDNPYMQGKRIFGVKVAGTTGDLKICIKKYDVQEVFFAIPSLSKKSQKEMVETVESCGCIAKVLPGIYQLATGQVNVSQLRKVKIQDLLGRDEIGADLDKVMGYISGKTVLVTGGGGSIGSELCRQIASHAPSELIVLDIYENNAYEIEQELKRKYPALKLLTLIASIRDEKKIRDIFEKYRPQIVFNAAAHKHVPLMETSPNEAVKNNVFGTLNVARAADEYKSEIFVQISTDKAVNPTNIMGATKRICEMIVQTIGRHSQNTKFVAVRFGNVLGSNGSVIPLFKKQIEEGGPVTVTHKDIIRYFMTIPEAVSLVLQAGAYAQGGQIFVLDMGEPVRIYDLAYNLIKLSGFEPNVDIEIKCVGLRPGEKLYEERLMEEEGLQRTENGLISIAKPIPLDEEKFWESLDKLYVEAHGETEKMKEWVKELVPTYTIDKHESSAVKFLKKENQDAV